MTIEDGTGEHENETLLKEQNEMLQRRLKRLEQQIAIMSRSARRSYPREQTRQQQEFKAPTTSSLTRSPMVSSVYAQGDAIRMSGWSLFGRWKECFCRVQGDKLLCWDSREDALSGHKADLVTSLRGLTIQLCNNNNNNNSTESKEEESYFRIVTKKNSSTQVRMKGM